MARADTVTIATKTPEYYSDFLINFDRNPVTGLLARVTNEDAVKNSIRNLVLTRLTERFYEPVKGSKAYSILFDQMDSVAEQQLQSTITTCINNFEPRASLIGVQVTGNYSNQTYHVMIYYSLINIPSKEFSVSIILKRAR